MGVYVVKMNVGGSDDVGGNLDGDEDWDFERINKGSKDSIKIYFLVLLFVFFKRVSMGGIDGM